ncbi:MAG TPA: PAS domain-containing protein, partial [Polyangiales bacterium]
MTAAHLLRSTASDPQPARARGIKDRSLFDAMPNGFALHEMIWDAAGRALDYRFLYVNPAFERMTGLRAEAVLGKTAREVWPQLGQTWIESCGRVASTGDPTHGRRHSATLGRDFEVIAYRTQQGQFACLFTDVTESTKLAAVLAEDQRRFQEVLDNVPDLVWSKDLDSRFISANEAFGLACGRKNEEIIGKSDLDLWPQDLAEHYRADDLEVITQGKRKQVVEALVESDGRRR